MRSTLGTSTLAEILGFSPRKISKLIDSGHLKGRKVPGSRFRRVDAATLRRYCKEFGLPHHVCLAAEPTLIAVLSTDASLATEVSDALRDLDAHLDVEVRRFDCSFALGSTFASTRRVGAIVLDLISPTPRIECVRRDITPARLEQKRAALVLLEACLPGATECSRASLPTRLLDAIPKRRLAEDDT
ncbi:MAG: helix-turn-helix domain-containing protein [Bdellovibrionota bacterium]